MNPSKSPFRKIDPKTILSLPNMRQEKVIMHTITDQTPRQILKYLSDFYEKYNLSFLKLPKDHVKT